MTSTSDLREHLLWLLRGGYAHIDLDGALAGLPTEMRGARTDAIPHTPWRLLEHMRIAQRDILEFSRRPDHVSPPHPDGYWPAQDGPLDDDEWTSSIAAFDRDAAEFQALVADPDNDLLAPFPWGDGQTLLREALLVADHNAYHVGQLVVVRRALGAWHDA